MNSDRRPKVSVVMPVYNERATIEEILRRVQAIELDKEIIVVDDGSTDGTRDLLAGLASQAPQPNTGEIAQPEIRRTPEAHQIRVLFQDANHGKGAALRRGFREAQGEVVIIQDADLEYDPKDYFNLLAPINQGVADAVYGSRFLGGPHRVLFFWHYLGNKLLTLASNIVTNLNLSDVWTGYKAFRRAALEKIQLKEDGFGFEQEITIKVARQGCRIYEVPISYFGRTYAEGKKISWKDGFRGIWCLVRYALTN
jgi:glycosyltransferase involved in cell wall biosynthesis